jgi:hypothetical protein
MTQTIQPRSWAILNEPDKDLPIQKPIPEETMRDLRSLEKDLYELQKELEGMVKACNSLSDARTGYLQATQKVTQSLTRLIQSEGIQDKEKGENGK